VSVPNKGHSLLELSNLLRVEVLMQVMNTNKLNDEAYKDNLFCNSIPCKLFNHLWEAPQGELSTSAVQTSASWSAQSQATSS